MCVYICLYIYTHISTYIYTHIYIHNVYTHIYIHIVTPSPLLPLSAHHGGLEEGVLVGSRAQRRRGARLHSVRQREDPAVGRRPGRRRGGWARPERVHLHVNPEYLSLTEVADAGQLLSTVGTEINTSLNVWTREETSTRYSQGSNIKRVRGVRTSLSVENRFYIRGPGTFEQE